MKRAFMIGVAAGALLAGANIAAAQGSMERQQPGAAGEQKSGSGAQQQQKGSGGAEKQDAQKQGDQKQDAQKQDAQKSGGGGGGQVTLSSEQKTKVRETVIRSGNAPRVTNVNFSVSVGTVIPRETRLAPLHPVLVEIYPQWRSYRYVIVEERIIIIEPDSFKIVAIVEV